MAGRFGLNCASNCSSACVPENGEIICDIVSANCSSGQCKSGFWKADCFTMCNSNCGSDTNGDVTCNINTGICDSSCKPGFYGDTCSMSCDTKCYDDTCDRVLGICEECLKENATFICPDARKF